MGLCGTKRVQKWDPEENDGNVEWMADYDGMMAQMIKDDADPDQWELDLAQDGLMNPPFNKTGDLEFGPHTRRRKEMWWKFKKGVWSARVKGDQSEAVLKKLATKILGTSPYLQMRAQQWLNKQKSQDVDVGEETEKAVSNNSVGGSDTESSKYAVTNE